MDRDQLVGGDIWLPAVSVLKWVMQETPAIRNKVVAGGSNLVGIFGKTSELTSELFWLTS